MCIVGLGGWVERCRAHLHFCSSGCPHRWNGFHARIAQRDSTGPNCTLSINGTNSMSMAWLEGSALATEVRSKFRSQKKWDRVLRSQMEPYVEHFGMWGLLSFYGMADQIRGCVILIGVARILWVHQPERN